MSTSYRVRLGVIPDLCSPLSPPYDASYFINDVAPGSKLIDVMNEAKSQGFQYESIEYPSLGAYVTSVNGKAANKDLKQYWRLVNGWDGKDLQLGISNYDVQDGDLILFKFSLFD